MKTWRSSSKVSRRSTLIKTKVVSRNPPFPKNSWLQKWNERTKLVFEKQVWDTYFFPLPCLPVGKIHVFARHADRAKSGVECWEHEFRDGRKRWQKEKDGKEKAQKLRHGRSRLHGYFGFVNGERSFSLEDVLSDSLSYTIPLSRSIRDGERNRTKGTSPIAPQRLPPHISPASSLQPPSFLLVLLRVSPLLPSSSSLNARIYSTVTFRSTRDEFVDRVPECLVI